MTPYDRSPRGGHQRGLAENRSNGIVGRTHPHCKRHDCRIVNELPRICPLRGAIPLDALTDYQRIGWMELVNSGTCFERGDVRGALNLLNHVDVCNRCIGDGMLANPTVRRLREGIARKGAK